MSEKRLYALTDEQVETLIGSADNWSRTLRMNNRESIQEDHAIAALTPVTVDDLGGDAIERMARVISYLDPGEPWPTNEELGGGPTGTRDDEYWHEFLNGLIRAALDELLQEDE